MDRLTLPFCLREVAKNIEKEQRLYLRVGPILLDYDSEDNNYVVHEKDGSAEVFGDLVEAINHFIAVVLYL